MRQKPSTMPTTAPTPPAPTASLMFPLDDLDVDDDVEDSLASLPASPGGAPPPPRPRAAAVAPCPATALKPVPTRTARDRATRCGREAGADPPKAASAPCAPSPLAAPVGDECCVCLEPFDEDPAAMTRCE